MKIIFVGQNILGGLTLSGLLNHGIHPEFVVTRMANDYTNLVSEVCSQFKQIERRTKNINVDNKLISDIIDFHPDVIFCSSWGDKIKKPLLQVPSIGWVNFHPSYLPAYRGPRPIEWQLINGEEWGGCTAHFMSEKFDEGPIILQQKVNISFKDNGETLRKKCGLVMGELAVATYNILLTHPDFCGTPQNTTGVTYAPPRENIRAINWFLPAVQIYNLVRGLSPYPCAVYNGSFGELEIADVEITDLVTNQDMIGHLFRTTEGPLLIGAFDRFVKISKIRIEGQIVDLTPPIAEQISKNIDDLQ